MSDNIKIYGGFVAVIAVLALAVWWQVYKFGDCRHVGHTRLYCIMSIGK